ncbi:uncharacterized protein LOC131929580 [Physella acuta]|uniref:uncharacterized protein LOC131929580 n=1 Tax=Physella acuta TaxID=109671 RepID=UPI0027DCC415|nr:uncharacterized protein LOC131929580 [Physella acuta]
MTAMEEDVDDRFAGIDIDSLLNRAEKRSFNYGRKKTLYEAPEFIQRLNGEETVMEGQSLCIECKVAGFPAPTLRWYKDDEEIVDHGRIHIESNGRGGYCLIIDNVNKGDEAAYRCRAENVEGASSSRFFLSVKSKPKSPKKKDAKSSPNRRTVSFPPMFATIVEKVEEEEKQGIELAKLPPSPMTEFYYALTLKSRQSWPTFLGDWAFANSPEKRRNSTGSIQDNHDSSSDEDVFTDSDSSSGLSETPPAQNPLFYLGNNNDEPSTHQDLVIFNTNALQSEDEIIENRDNTNNNLISTFYPENSNNYLKLDNAQENDLKILNSDSKKKKGNNDKEKCKEKSENVSLTQELGNMKVLNTAQDRSVSKGFEANLGYASDHEKEKPSNVLKIPPTFNLEGSNVIFSNTRAGAMREAAPPIVVEMWDEVEEPRSPNLRSSDSIRIPNGNSLDAYMREEREPTPFSFGSSLTSESLLHGVKDDDIFNLDSPRVTRESTVFLDKGGTGFLGGSPEIENKEFHREPTPFYDNKTTATLCFGTELQIPGNISVDREPRELTPFFKEDIEKSPRSTLDSMKTSSSSKVGAEAKSVVNTKRGIPVPPSKSSKVKSKTSGDKKDLVNITVNADNPHTLPSPEENAGKNLNTCKNSTKDVRGAMAVSGERRSRSETRANRSQTTVEVATVEAPKPRQLSVPRDTSPTVATTSSQVQTSRQQKDLTKSGQDKKQSSAKLNKSPQISKQQPSTSKLTANVTRSTDAVNKQKQASNTGRENKAALNQNANQDLDVDKTNQKVKTKGATATVNKGQAVQLDSKPKSKQSSTTNGKKAESDSITTKESKRKTQQTLSDTQKPLTLTSRLKKSIKVLMPQTENKPESSRMLSQSTDQDTALPDLNFASMPVVLANPFASFDTMRTSHFGVSLITNPPPADTTMPHNKPIAMVKARPKHVTSVTSDSSSRLEAQGENGLDASNRRPRDVKPKTLSGTLTSFFKPKPTDKENKKKTSKPTDRKRKSKSSKHEELQERSAVVDSETSVKTLSELALAKCSPFGRHSMEGLLFIFIMTMICLNLEMPVEKFLCYIIASFYTFCVLRILGLVD